MMVRVHQIVFQRIGLIEMRVSLRYRLIREMRLREHTERYETDKKWRYDVDKRLKTWLD